MIGHKKKSDAQRAWDLVKKVVRAKATLRASIIRDQMVDDELAAIWPAFKAGLSGGEIKGLNAEQENWVRDALASVKKELGS